MQVRSYAYSNSPNANASRDIVQTLDPRNPTIFDYVYVDIVKTMVAGFVNGDGEPDSWVTIEVIRRWNKLGPISKENVC